MGEQTLAARLRAGETLFTAWSGIPDPLVAEFLARSPFDAVTLDMQHGCHTTESVLRCIPAIRLAGKPPVVRVPVGRFDMASRALDFGAAAVIAPMINSVAEAKAFAAAMKYPPVGERSWGTSRVMPLLGEKDPQRYLASAGHDTLAIAMVETRAAIAALDDILAVEGIDGIFVGPSDLSIALSDGARMDTFDAETLKAAEDIAARTAKAGKIPCTLGVSGEAAGRFRDVGFRFVAISSDFGCLLRGATALREAAG